MQKYLHLKRYLQIVLAAFFYRLVIGVHHPVLCMYIKDI